MILYNLRSEYGPGMVLEGFRITKFDDDLNVESSYLVSEIACECPQGHKPKCRHRTMLPLMRDRVNTAWFYCYDSRLWYDPTGTAEPVVAANGGPLTAPAGDMSTSLSETHLQGVPEGVEVVGLGDPEKLHNAVANAVGEPTIRRRI